MVILKFVFFRVRQTKGNLVWRQWIDVSLMSLVRKGYTFTLEIKNFDSNVQQKVLKHEKR